MNGFKESSRFGGGEASQQVDFAFGIRPTVPRSSSTRCLPSSHPNTSIPQLQQKLLVFKAHLKLRLPPYAEKISRIRS